MPCPLLNKGARISNPPIPPGAAGVLRPPATSSRACLSIAYRGLKQRMPLIAPKESGCASSLT